jgi:hypothetical protein
MRELLAKRKNGLMIGVLKIVVFMFSVINLSCYLELETFWKTSFAANYTDFREFQKNPCKLAKFAARILGFFAWKHLGLII